MISFVRSSYVGHFCSRSASYKRLQVIREGKMLYKMIEKNLTKKNVEDYSARKLKQEFLVSAYDNEGINRKTASLNKFYMEQLIELINCGPFSSELTELGIQFSKVRLSSCRSSINIYWSSNKGNISDSEISQVLEKTRKDLQAQIGLMRSMRKIPFVAFVKDSRLEKALNVEKLFEVADFGKDHTTSNPRKVVKSDSSVKQEANEENVKMRENVLGLNRAEIEEKIMQNIRRFQAINIKQDKVQKVEQYEVPGKLVVFSKNLFMRFYKRKLYLDKKLRRREHNETYFDLREPYDPDQEAEKHWEFLNCKVQLQEFDKYFAEGDCDEDSNDMLDYGDFDLEEGDSGEELCKKEECNKEINKV